MLQEKEQTKAQSALLDNETIYGWTSILLHWVTAIVIIVIWFIGKSIASAASEEVDAQRQLHVSIAATAFLLLLLRLVWRFRSGHPHIRGQTLLTHCIAKTIHYTMLIVLGLMLVSGPLVVWSNGHPISIFGWAAIPGPIAESDTLNTMAWFIHRNSSMMLFWLVLLHIGGALKHLMFHDDDTIVRMIWPGTGTKDKTNR